MKYDVVIIGGGLSALVCGILLQEKGKDCLIVSSGQSALHFFSGSFDLIATEGPFREAMGNLPNSHPYRKMGPDHVMELAGLVPGFFSRVGYRLVGENDRNHIVKTPLGTAKRVWLTVDAEGNPPVRGKLPISPLGVRMQMDLRRRFESLGGEYLLGDKVIRGEMLGDHFVSVFTENHGPTPFVADNFVMATGSFFSGGLVAASSQIVEPVLLLDVDYYGSRTQWYDADFFAAHPYMRFGAATGEGLRALKSGETVPNVFVTGSLLSGADAIKEGCGAGVAIISAMYVAEQILEDTL